MIPKSSPPSAVSLHEWADKMGLSYRTAWRMARTGTLPKSVEVVRFKTGTIRIIERETKKPEELVTTAVIYARINSRSEQSDLEEQLKTCMAFCLVNGWAVHRIVREKAPGFGPKRRRLHSLLVAPPRRLIVSRPSVLSRFDLTVTEILLRNLGCELVVVNRDEGMNGRPDALEDLTDAISATCNLHYGLKKGGALVANLNRLITRRNDR